MEAGFFNEGKCSMFHNQADDLNVEDGSIFDRLVLPGMQYDPLSTLWDQMDEDNVAFGGSSSCGENGSRGNRKEDFHKMFNDWQEHLSSMQVLDIDKLRSDMPDMFTLPPLSQPEAEIEEFFPDDCSITIKEEVILKEEPEEVLSPMVEDLKEEGEINSDGEEEKIDNSSKIIKHEGKDVVEDESIDIETVGEKIPVLEAGDVKTLLEQFEASEAVNTTCKEAEQQSDMSHQNIRDALPKEVIDRIKASARKKLVSLIPAMPTKKCFRAATRMQDAAVTLCRNKLLKLVSTGESVQLDHDYCSGTAGSEELVPPPQNFYQADVAEYSTSSVYSRLPDYYVALAPQKALEPSKSKNKDWNEKNSKKDSGLESGDVSDASEEVPPPPPLPSTKPVSMVSVLKRNNLPQKNFVNTPSSCNSVPVASVCSSNNNRSRNNDSSNSNSSSNSSNTDNSIINVESSSSMNIETVQPTVTADEPVRKRKLNLEEYRSRREERERVRNKEGSSQYSCSDSSRNSPLSSSIVSTEPGIKEDSKNDINQQNQKVVHNVEIQATPEGVEGNSNSGSKTKIKTNQDASRRRREYRKRRVSSSSSSSSLVSRRSKHRSSRRIRKHSHSDSRSNGTSQTRKRSIWSRSPSYSSRSSCSTCTSISRSRSHSRSRSRSSHHSDTRRSGGGKWAGSSRTLWRTKHRFNKSYNNSQEPRRHRRTSSRTGGSSGRESGRESMSHNSSEWSDKEKLRQVEERRVIYVGRLEEGTTKAYLRERFSVFGPIIDISVHFREHGDNYGFVTFAYKVDAYEAVEHGNDDPSLSRYDLSFGGRRAFCKQRYADLDGERNNIAYRSMGPGHRPDASFDLLLREAQSHLKKRSSV